MKKSILATILLMSAIWCDAQSGVIPADTIITIIPQWTFKVDTSTLMFQGQIVGTDANGNTKNIPFFLNGIQALQPTKANIIAAAKGR